MMGGVSPETCWASYKYGIIKFWYIVASFWILFYKPVFVCFSCNSPQWARAPSFGRFLDHTQRRITVGRTSLDKWSDRRRDLFLTTHNTHNRQTSMPPVGFEPKISAGERPQT
jgi:hypothetical protein